MLWSHFKVFVHFALERNHVVAALSLPKLSHLRSRVYRRYMTQKADVIDDATKQMWLIAFFRMFFRVPPTQMTTYDQKFGMKMIARTWRLLLFINAKKSWFSTNEFSKLPLRISCLIMTVMEVQIVLYDNLRTFRGMKDFRLKYRLKYKKWNS